MHSTQLPLSLARALAADVPPATRAKGASYFHSGAVASLVTFKDGIAGTVRGTRDYHVEVSREQEGFIGSCECPYFLDRFAVCKHIWAVVLAADDRGLLPPHGPRAWIEPVEVPTAMSTFALRLVISWSRTPAWNAPLAPPPLSTTASLPAMQTSCARALLPIGS